MKNKAENLIRKISSKEELKQNQSVIHLLNQIVSESEIDLNISMKTANLKSFTDQSKTWKVTDKWMENKEILVAEIDGVPKAVLVYMINDPETKVNLGIKDKNFVIMIKAITTRDVRNTGILGELTQNLLRNTAGLDPIYISCVSNKAVVDEFGKESIVVMNLDQYAYMHKKTFLNNYLQMRYKDDAGNQFGREKKDLKSFLNSSNELDNNKIGGFIKRHEALAKLENKEVMGFYVVGEDRKKWTTRIENERQNTAQLSRL
jgi:hypothetical protein